MTISHLRFGDKPIRAPYYINKADFVACHNPSYVIKGYKMVNDVKPGGVFMINCQWTPEELDHHMPAEAKRYIAKNNIQLYTINAIDKAIEIGLGKRTNTILQSAFFALAGVLPKEDALKYMKDAAEKSFAKKGQAIVEMNWKAIDAGFDAYHKVEVPASWTDAQDAPVAHDLAGNPATVDMVDEGDVPRGQDGRRQPAGFCVRKVCGRPVRAGRLRIREARRGRVRAGVGCHQVHPVQPVRLCLPARHHSSVCADRRGGGRRARGAESQEDDRQGLRGLSVRHDRLAAGLHGLRRVRGRVPGPRQGAEDGAAGERSWPSRTCSTTAWPTWAKKPGMMAETTVKGGSVQPAAA